MNIFGCCFMLLMIKPADLLHINIVYNYNRVYEKLCVGIHLGITVSSSVSHTFDCVWRSSLSSHDPPVIFHSDDKSCPYPFRLVSSMMSINQTYGLIPGVITFRDFTQE